MLRGRKTLALLGLLAVLTFSPAFAKPKPLFVPARRSAPMIGMDDDSRAFTWLSDHELLGNREISDTQWQLVRIDLADKTISPLAGLNKILAPINSSESSVDPLWQASPDGKWVLVYGYYHDSQPTSQPANEDALRRQVIAYSIDGKRKVTFTEPLDPDIEFWLNQYTLTWLPDSRRWVALTSHAAFFFSLDDPDKVDRVDVVHDESSPDEDPSLFSGLRVTPNGHFILAKGDAPPSDNTYTIADVDLNANPIVFHTITIPTPPLSSIDAVAVSPDGKRLAWMWDVERTTDTPAKGDVSWKENQPTNHDWWTGHDPPVSYHTDSDNPVEVWMSSLDGSDFHLVGRSDTETRTLLWSPDGKTIYFTYGDYFWGFPAK